MSDLIYSSDVAFTPAVKQIQARKGSRAGYARMEEGGSWQTRIDPSAAAFISHQRSAYLATSSRDGQPYIQHRGGPPGFIKVLDDHTLGFADYTGNRQYISQGNLTENSKAMLFLMDYRNRRRLKIWGTARVVEGDDALMAKLMPKDYRARPEQVILIDVTALDQNCHQHIPVRLDLDEVAELLAEKDGHIRELEAEISRLRTTATDRLAAEPGRSQPR